jgi:hypothetical protein
VKVAAGVNAHRIEQFQTPLGPELKPSIEGRAKEQKRVLAEKPRVIRHVASWLVVVDRVTNRCVPPTSRGR